MEEEYDCSASRLAVQSQDFRVEYMKKDQANSEPLSWHEILLKSKSLLEKESNLQEEFKQSKKKKSWSRKSTFKRPLTAARLMKFRRNQRTIEVKRQIREDHLHGEHSVSRLSKQYGRSPKAVKQILQLEEPIELEHPQVSRYHRQTQAIKQVVESTENRYFITEILRREIPNELRPCRDTTREIVKNLGYRFKKLHETISEKRKTKRPHEQSKDQEAKMIFSKLLEGLDNKLELYFMDGFKIMPDQIPLRGYAPVGQRGKDIQKRIPVSRTPLSCCMIVGIQKVLMYQVFEGELRAHDINFFLHAFLQDLQRSTPEDSRIVIVLDRAQWHLAKVVSSGPLKPYLLYNEVSRPEYNLIENLFSKLRNLFRSRQVVETVEAELDQFFQLVKNCDDENDFAGYRRMLLRTLITVAESQL